MALTAAAEGGAAALQAQVIQGRLLTAFQDEPIELGMVALVSENGATVAFAMTGAEGRFVLPAPAAGRYRVRGAAGFHEPLTEGPVEIQEGQTIDVEFRLLPRPVQLDSLLVSVARRIPRLAQVGFYERARHTHGYFLTQEEIDRRPGRFTAELLRGIPGVLVQYGEVGPPALLLRARASVQAGPVCVPTLYFDGVLHHNDRGTSINDITPDQIAGLELYTTQLRVPSAYAHGLTGCGVILIWTRR